MRIKYPRTFHLPWSQGATDDDKTHSAADVAAMFAEVVVTEKLDGENTTVYADGTTHARSLDSGAHVSRDWLKAHVAPMLIGNLPAGWRVCGENLFAQHSCGYDRLTTYFVVFAIYNDANECLSWDETVEWCDLLGLVHAPVLYRGAWNESAVRACYTGASAFGVQGEGYVVRNAGSFGYDSFSENVAKFVRAGHVQAGTAHWSLTTVRANKLAA